ncbi:MAG: hypothetical protein Q8M83_02115 [bacterium]|nr:hypothetical protein [bacterium]
MKRLTQKAVVDGAVIRIINQILLIMGKEGVAKAQLFCDGEKGIFAVFDGALLKEKMYPSLPLFNACVGRLRRMAKLPLNRQGGDKEEKEGSFYLTVDGKKKKFQIKARPDGNGHERVEISMW